MGSRHLFIYNDDSPYLLEENIVLMAKILSSMLESVDNVRLFRIINKEDPVDITDTFDSASFHSAVENVDFGKNYMEFAFYPASSGELPDRRDPVCSEYLMDGWEKAAWSRLRVKNPICRLCLMDNDGILLVWDSKALPFLSRRSVARLSKRVR